MFFSFGARSRGAAGVRRRDDKRQEEGRGEGRGIEKEKEDGKKYLSSGLFTTCVVILSLFSCLL